jgi:hypothetical protein
LPRVQEPEQAPRLPALKGARAALAIAWLLGVTALYLAVRVFGLALVP